MLTILLLPFYLGRLSLAVFPTILELIWAKLSHYQALLLAGGLLIFAAFISSAQLLFIPRTTPPLNPLMVVEQYFEGLTHQQATHRDVLLDLSRIYQAIGNNTKATEYRHQAEQLDPNNSLFTREE